MVVSGQELLQLQQAIGVVCVKEKMKERTVAVAAACVRERGVGLLHTFVVVKEIKIHTNQIVSDSIIYL